MNRNRSVALIAIGIVGIALGSGMTAGAADRGSRAETEVRFDGILYNTSEGKTEIYGRVISPRKDCAKNRKIIVYRVEDGADAKVGSDKAEKDGTGYYRWYIAKAGIRLG